MEMHKQTFKTSDGIDIAYYIDDFSDPWRPADPLLVLHPAMAAHDVITRWFQVSRDALVSFAWTRAVMASRKFHPPAYRSTKNG